MYLEIVNSSLGSQTYFPHLVARPVAAKIVLRESKGLFVFEVVLSLASPEALVVVHSSQKTISNQCQKHCHKSQNC